MKSISISLKEKIDNILKSRDEAIKLFNWIGDNYSKDSSMDLDFKNVDFMSRSFADQYHKEKITLSKSLNITFLISNESQQICEILKAVAETQKKSLKKSDSWEIINITNEELLMKYLTKI